MLLVIVSRFIILISQQHQVRGYNFTSLFLLNIRYLNTKLQNLSPVYINHEDLAFTIDCLSVHNFYDWRWMWLLDKISNLVKPKHFEQYSQCLNDRNKWYNYCIDKWDRGSIPNKAILLGMHLVLYSMCVIIESN